MYGIVFTRRAKRSFAKLGSEAGKRVLDKLEWTAENIESIQLVPLSHDLVGTYKLRVGQYRVIYEINRQKGVLTVLSVAHRREVYRDL